MITRRTFFESLAAVAAGLVLPEPRRVRAYSFMPGILGGQPVEIGDRVAIDARDPSRVYRVPRVRV